MGRRPSGNGPATSSSICRWRWHEKRRGERLCDVRPGLNLLHVGVVQLLVGVSGLPVAGLWAENLQLQELHESVLRRHLVPLGIILVVEHDHSPLDGDFDVEAAI
jgi:hypothetical protein